MPVLVLKVVKDKIYDRRSYERSSQGLRDEFYDRNSFGRSSLSSRIDDKNIRHHTDDRRSPSYGTENGRSGARRSRSTARFEIVDDRFRDDEYGSGRRSQGRGFSNTISRAASMSPEAQRIREKANPSPPVLRPLKDIMGDPPPPKPNRQATDGSTYAQVRLFYSSNFVNVFTVINYYYVFQHLIIVIAEDRIHW